MLFLNTVLKPHAFSIHRKNIQLYMNAQKAENTTFYKTLQKFKNSKYQKRTAAKQQPAVVGETT